MKIILDDLKFENPIKFYSDNKSAINITPNPIQHHKTKHIEIWVIFHQGQFGKTCLYVLSSILSDCQLADIQFDTPSVSY